jgi:hypothetical protein
MTVSSELVEVELGRREVGGMGYYDLFSVDMMRVASSAKLADPQVGYLSGGNRVDLFERILDPCVLFTRDFSNPSLGLKHGTPNG